MRMINFQLKIEGEKKSTGTTGVEKHNSHTFMRRSVVM